jgi:hypothetical protein
MSERFADDVQRSRPAARARHGAILAMVLASLLVASLLGLALVETLLLHHRQMQAVGRQQQSFWLAEAGLQRAIQRLAKSPDYGGEEWIVPAEVLGAAQPGVVVIEVTKADGPTEARKIKVEARFPDDPVRRNVFRRTFTWQ